jgi:hypothetical protein
MAKSKKLSAAAEKTLKMMRQKAKTKPKKKAVPPPKGKAPIKPKIRAAKPEPVKAPVKPPAKLIEKHMSYGKEDLAFFRKIIMEKKKEILEDMSTLRDSMMDSQTGEYASENSTY